jgi:hypothetical protein
MEQDFTFESEGVSRNESGSRSESVSMSFAVYDL